MPHSFRTTLKIIGFTLVGLTLFLKTTHTIIDPDFAWHLKVGEYIWQEKTIPTQDLYSFSVPESEYVYHSWLSEAVFFIIYQDFGLHGVSFLLSLTFLVGVGFLFASTKEKSISSLIFTGMFIFPSGLLNGVGIRIQTFTYTALAILFYLLLNSRGFKTSNKESFFAWLIQTKLVFLFPLFFVWTNLHGGFITGITMLAIFFIGILSQSLDTIETKQTQQKIRNYVLTFTGATLATLFNPQGLNLHVFTWKMLSNLESNKYNLDWIPFYANDNPQIVILNVIIFSWALFLVLYHKKNYFLKSTLPLLILLNFVSNRFLIVMIIWIIPFTVDFMIAFLKKIKFPALAFVTFIIYLGLLGEGVKNIDNYIKNYSSEENFITSKIEAVGYSYQAHQYMKNNKLPGNMFHSINWGGYLQWYFPEMKIFADAKMDNYYIGGKPFVSTYYDMSTAEGDWQEKLDSYQINTVYLPTDYPLVVELKKLEAWETVYTDKKATILVRISGDKVPYIDTTYDPIKFGPAL